VAIVAHQASKGNLDDELVEAMLDVIATETIGSYRVNEDTILKAGRHLATYGTPESCLLAMHLSNYSGVRYPEEINEIIREAACLFVSCPDSSILARIIEIVRGKYLFEDPIRVEEPTEINHQPQDEFIQ
jgi:hypothetical protein